jgi:predicted phage-related endonuclease
MEKTVNAQTAEAISELAQVRSIIKGLQERESELRDTVIVGMGDAEVAVFRNQAIARLTQVTRTTIDSKKLQEQYPEVFADTKRETTSPRLTLV